MWQGKIDGTLILRVCGVIGRMTKSDDDEIERGKYVKGQWERQGLFQARQEIVVGPPVEENRQRLADPRGGCRVCESSTREVETPLDWRPKTGKSRLF